MALSSLTKRRAFFGLMTISDQPGQHIDHKINRRTKTRLLDLGNVLELVNDGLNQSPFARQKLIGHDHQAVLHVLAQLGNQLDLEVLPELLKERPGNITSVSK